MKKKLNKLGLPLLLFAILVFLQKFYAYHFFYIEQFQLFTNTYYYFVETWSHPGGGIEYVSSFLLQFYTLPVAGPVIVATLTTLLFFVAFSLQNKLSVSNKNWLIPATVTVSYFFLFLDLNYYLQGNMAFTFMLLILPGFISIKNPIVKRGLAFIFIPLLFWFAGSISLLFAICLSIIEIQRNGFARKQIYWIFLPLWAVIISFLGVRFGFVGEFRMSFLPDMYYQPRLTPNFTIYLPWALLILWFVFLPLLKKKENKKRGYLLLSAQIIIFAGVTGLGIKNLGDRKFYTIQKLDYYARNEQWDKIIRIQAKEETSNYLILNYVNLALAEKGLLLERLFNVGQHGIQGLKVSPQNKRLLAPLLSDINYCFGDIASSQQYAFEGNQACRGTGSGRLLKRLTETAIIFGNQEIAKKYIAILKHTRYYRKWATEQEAALIKSELTPDIISKQKDLPQGNSREFAKDFPEQLEQLCSDNPENNNASSYLQAYYLLSKDLENLSFFCDKQYLQNEEKKKIPAVCQQALVAYYETKPEVWNAKGITTETINLYKIYKSFLRKHYQDTQLKERMQGHFGTTFWYYFQFN